MSKVIVETSARHVHLTEEHIKILFGEGATLTKKKDLSHVSSLVPAAKLKSVKALSQLSVTSTSLPKKLPLPALRTSRSFPLRLHPLTEALFSAML